MLSHMQKFPLLYKAGILASKIGFEPKDRDLGLEAGIWAWRLRYGPGGGGGTEKEEEKEEEEEKIPLMNKNMGHRTLWGRCPTPSLNINHNLLRQGKGTADHLTLWRLI